VYGLLTATLSYYLASNFPRVAYSDLNQTLEQAKLFPQALLFLSEKPT
jgi:hypothetical protein